ncbi:MAG TPA: hypothetical protein VGQ36_00265 [Thermoanaerobaculia bacterium]|jgi:hypothetical protein|nr:hypothetical protein [Thermoanaerobaculia bacterium]
MLRIAIVAAVLLATFPAHAALVPGVERPVSAPAVGTAGISDVLSVATDGTDFLTLWMEKTPGPREGLYATIVNEQGVPRAGVPAPLVRGFSLGHAVWVGDAYLVVLSNGNGTTVLRMNRDAQVISDREPIDTGAGLVVDLAWNGSRALAVVSHGPTLSGLMLDAHGRVLRSGIAIPAQKQKELTATAAGEAFVVTWADEIEAAQYPYLPVLAARAVRISADGSEVSAPKELMVRRGVVDLDSASSGNEAGIVIMVREDMQAHRDLLRFTVDGPTFAIEAHRSFSVLEETQAVQVLPTSGGFTAVYVFSERFGIAQFDSQTRRSFPIGGVWVNGNVRMETNGRTVMAILQSTTVVGVAVDAQLTRRTSEAAPVSLAWRKQTTPVLASAGTTMLAAWIEDGFPTPALVAQRRDADGHALDAAPIVLSRNILEPPAIAFTGRVWLVAWTGTGYDSRGFYTTKVSVQRISADGVPLDAQPIEAGIGEHPALASNGRVAALVMSQPDYKPPRLVRFAPEGTLIDSTPLAFARSFPSVATNGEEFLVTGVDRSTNPYDDTTYILGLRLAADGALMDAAPIAIATGPLRHAAARVASDGTDFVVVYVESDPDPIYDPPPAQRVYRVVTKRVLRNGALANRTAEQGGARLGEGTDPKISAFGDGYAVAFITNPDQSLVALPLDARGVRLAPGRAVLPHPYASDLFDIAAMGDAVHVAYERLTPELGDVTRVYIRELKEQASRRRNARK